MRNGPAASRRARSRQGRSRYLASLTLTDFTAHETRMTRTVLLACTLRVVLSTFPLASRSRIASFTFLWGDLTLTTRYRFAPTRCMRAFVMRVLTVLADVFVPPTRCEPLPTVLTTWAVVGGLEPGPVVGSSSPPGVFGGGSGRGVSPGPSPGPNVASS